MSSQSAWVQGEFEASSGYPRPGHLKKIKVNKEKLVNRVAGMLTSVSLQFPPTMGDA